MKTKNKLFNSVQEMSLRVLLLLSKNNDSYYSLEKIVSIDFITCYSADFKIPYPNLHGINKFKFGEIANRRMLVKNSIKYLTIRGLIEIKIENGYKFRISQLGYTYVNLLESPYSIKYREIAESAINKYGKDSDENILKLVCF